MTTKLLLVVLLTISVVANMVQIADTITLTLSNARQQKLLQERNDHIRWLQERVDERNDHINTHCPQ